MSNLDRQLVLEQAVRRRVQELNIVGSSFGMADVPHLVATTMELAEAFDDQPGAVKKRLVIEVVKTIIASFDQENAVLWDDFLALILPQLIDIYVHVDAGNLRINAPRARGACDKLRRFFASFNV
jgi:hypothetical protein